MSSMQNADSTAPAEHDGGPSAGRRIISPAHGRFRLSLRGLLCLIVAIACGMAWVARVMRTGQDQRVHVKAIYRAGGSVVYGSEWIEKPTAGTLVTHWPGWLVNYFSSVVVVDLRGRGNDDVLAHVGHLTQLRQLHVTGRAITDAGLADLRDLRSLQLLSVENSQVTDAGLEHLRLLKSLKRLTLSGTNVTDDGVEKLKQALPGLQITR